MNQIMVHTGFFATKVVMMREEGVQQLMAEGVIQLRLKLMTRDLS